MDQQRAPATREELMSALFANMVLQQTNLALMFLGRVPNPETGEHLHDLDTAQMFIDQLEMLEVKTKSNLSKQEETLLRQSLTAVRMAFVEATSQEKSSGAAGAPAKAAGARPAESPPTAPAEKAAAEPAEPEESRKKFTKKY